MISNPPRKFLTWNELSLRHKPFGYLVKKLGGAGKGGNKARDEMINKMLEIIHKGNLAHAVSSNKFKHSKLPPCQA